MSLQPVCGVGMLVGLREVIDCNTIIEYNHRGEEEYRFVNSCYEYTFRTWHLHVYE